MRFLLVDEILELTPGQSIRAVKTLGPEEELFHDHFPGFPVVPGVLLTEMMAQTAGKCLDAERLPRGKPMLAQIKSATFRDWVRPGQPVTMVAEIKNSKPQFATAHCRCEVNGKPVCSAELMFAFLPVEHFSSAWRDDVLERYLSREKGGTGNAANSGA